MDDTNPTKEETEYVNSIMTDVRWLIDGWADKHLGGAPLYASDYFDRFYEYALDLVRKGKAYVDDMSREQTDEYRRIGKESPFRNRPVEENLDLLGRMKAGEFADNTHTLRAKIDMSAPNVWLRDPVLYRIRHASHHRTGDKWCIYPMYDWAHTLSDYIEGHHAFRFARLSSKCTGRFTIGSSTRSNCPSRVRINTNLRGSISPTRSSANAN